MSDAGTGVEVFLDVIDRAAASFCAQHGYPDVTDTWRASVAARLPIGLRLAMAEAVLRGVIAVPTGTAGFVIPALPGKGPYALFSRSSKRVPAPNWEYFVQLAEYARLAEAAARRGWRIGFEDGLMDVSVYAGNDLLWCVEVKERARDLGRLVQQIGRHGMGIDWDREDRGDDPLRKAKYLATKRPAWFSAGTTPAGHL